MSMELIWVAWAIFGFVVGQIHLFNLLLLAYTNKKEKEYGENEQRIREKRNNNQDNSKQ